MNKRKTNKRRINRHNKSKGGAMKGQQGSITKEELIAAKKNMQEQNELRKQQIEQKRIESELRAAGATGDPHDNTQPMTHNN